MRTYNLKRWRKRFVIPNNTDGSLDTSFDTDGKVTTDFIGTADGARGVAIEDDGKIVVAGYTVTISTGYDFGVARYDANGALDPTFGTGVFSFQYFGTAGDVPLESVYLL